MALSEQDSGETIAALTLPEVEQPQIKQEDGGKYPRLTELLRERADFLTVLTCIEKDNVGKELAPQAPRRPQMPGGSLSPTTELGRPVPVFYI